MMKKILAILVASAMMIGALTACGNNTGATKESSSSSSKSSSSQTATNSQASASTSSSAEVKEEAKAFDGGGKTITVGIQTRAMILDYVDNAFTKYLEDKLNIKIEFVYYPESEFTTQLALAASSGEKLPDVITSWMGYKNCANFGMEGVFVPLNEYIENEEISPNWYAIPEADRKDMLSYMTAADGNVYGLAEYYPYVWNMTPHRMYINKTWLDKLGLEIPTTTDELYEVLIAFRDKDPNGNGIKDEIPLFGNYNDGYGKNTLLNIINCYTYFEGIGGNYGLEVDENGKVFAPYTTDEFREAIEFLHKLSAEGLLTNAIFTDDDAQFKATLNLEPNVVGFTTSGGMGNWIDYKTNPESNFYEYEIIKPLSGPEGVSYVPFVEYEPAIGWAVTVDCEDPEFAYRVGEAFYETETSYRVRMGEKDVDWSMNKEYMSKINSDAYTEMNGGYPYAVYDINIEHNWSNQNSQSWYSTGPKYIPLGFNWTAEKDNIDPEHPFNRPNAYNLKYYSPAHPEIRLPFMMYNQEDQDKLSKSSIKAVYDKYVAAFVTGSIEINDQNWKAYEDELDKALLQEVIDIVQKRYDEIK